MKCFNKFTKVLTLCWPLAILLFCFIFVISQQAFAVAKDGAIIWQTENWDLIEDIKEIVNAPQSAAGKVNAGGVKYKRVRSAQDFYIGSADSNQGHLLVVKINDSSWAIAWAESSAVPELTIIDVTKTSIHLKGNI